MTGRDYIDELILRLARHDVSTDMNTPSLLTFINRARQRVQKATMPLYPERYGKIFRFSVGGPIGSNGFLTLQLPIDFLDVFVILLEWRASSNVTYRTEARRTDAREISNVVEHSWNGPSEWTPVYTIQRPINSSPPFVTDYYYNCLISLGANGQAFLDNVTNVVAEIVYTSALDDLELDDDDETIPVDVEELVIYYAMLLSLQRSQEEIAVQSVQAEINMLMELFKTTYDVGKAKETVLLPSKEGED